MAFNSSFDPFSLDPMLEFYVRQSGVIIEELDEADLALIEEMIQDKNKINQLRALEEMPELVEAEVLAPESLEKISEEEESTDDFFEATEDDALAESEFSQIEDKTLGASLITEFVEPTVKDEALIIVEPPIPEEPKLELTGKVKENKILQEVAENQPQNVEITEEPKEIEPSVEIPEPVETKEKSPDVMMKVEVEFSEDRSLGQATVFRMSLESLPTSSAAASEMQSTLTINTEGLSPSPSSSSLLTSTSDQEGTSPKDGRAGRYNKKPAPPRPKEALDEDGPLKARLVLKPGVVRKLPEAAASDSEAPGVFLNQNAKEKKKSGGRSLLGFWHSKPQQPPPESHQDANKSTDL